MYKKCMFLETQFSEDNYSIASYKENSVFTTHTFYYTKTD